MSFELSNEIDKSKVFLVNLSKLEGYYSPLFFKSKPNPIPHSKKLKTIATINPIRTKPKFEPDELVPYVGLPETDEKSNSITEVVLRPYKEVAGRNIVYRNEIFLQELNQVYLIRNTLKLKIYTDIILLLHLLSFISFQNPL